MYVYPYLASYMQVFWDKYVHNFVKTSNVEYQL